MSGKFNLKSGLPNVIGRSTLPAPFGCCGGCFMNLPLTRCLESANDFRTLYLITFPHTLSFRFFRNFDIKIDRSFALNCPTFVSLVRICAAGRGRDAEEEDEEEEEDEDDVFIVFVLLSIESREILNVQRTQVLATQ